MIDIISYYDNHHEMIFENLFLPTFQKYLTPSFNLLTYKNKSKYTTSGFQSNNWCDIMINRFDILKEYIVNNKSKWAIFSDIDIIFFDNFITDIVQYYCQQNIEIIYMSEVMNNHTNWLINGGFFLFKCSDYIYDYFNTIQINIKNMNRPNDQTFIHNYLKENINFKNAILDQEIFVTNNNNNIQDIKNLIVNNKIKVFHATATMSVLSKIQILSTAMCIKSLTENYETNEKKSRLWI
jgi:hypothetical protein